MYRVMLIRLCTLVSDTKYNKMYLSLFMFIQSGISTLFSLIFFSSDPSFLQFLCRRTLLLCCKMIEIQTTINLLQTYYAIKLCIHYMQWNYHNYGTKRRNTKIFSNMNQRPPSCILYFICSPFPTQSTEKARKRADKYIHRIVLIMENVGRHWTLTFRQCHLLSLHVDDKVDAQSFVLQPPSLLTSDILEDVIVKARLKGSLQYYSSNEKTKA